LEKGGKLTSGEEDRIKEYLSGQLSECLASSAISTAGQGSILELFLDMYK